MYSRPETAPQSLSDGTIVRQRISAAGHVASKRWASGTAAHDSSDSNAHRLAYERSTLAVLDQQGSARIRLPHSGKAALQAVLINTAGGLTGGDDLRWSATAGPRSRLTLSTAACEKLYRTHGPAAHQNTQLVIEKGARLDWLPQETIVFDGASLQRSLEVDVAADATALMVESLILGRHAMQETVDRLQLHDRWRIRRDGRLLHAEDLRLQFDGSANALRASMLHQYGALSTVVYVSPEHEEALQAKADSLRTLIPEDTSALSSAVTLMNHRLVIRVLAKDNLSLRRFLIPCIERLNDHLPIPQVWNV